MADGYLPDFLGVAVPLPAAPAAQPVRELAYTHFTVLLDTGRTLAAATAVNIDGASLLDLGRGDDWHLDERVPADQQAGPELYAGNDLDRGHLVRRRDPVWGDPAEAGRANLDTFAYPNAAPQVATFNQSEQVWLGLEDHVLEHARAHRLRLSVLTGPVLLADDPLYRGVQIPRAFWKVAAWAETGTDADASTGTAPVLAATAYVLDQSEQLGAITLSAAGEDGVPALGPFRTYQVPVADVAALTGLDLGPLVDADRLVTATASAQPGPRARWRELRSPADVQLG